MRDPIVLSISCVLGDATYNIGREGGHEVLNGKGDGFGPLIAIGQVVGGVNTTIGEEHPSKLQGDDE